MTRHKKTVLPSHMPISSVEVLRMEQIRHVKEHMMDATWPQRANGRVVCMLRERFGLFYRGAEKTRGRRWGVEQWEDQDGGSS